MIDNDPLAECAMVDVNCRAVVALTHLLARSMVERGRGGIVLFSSVVASQGVPLSANYAATKAFVHTLGEGLRHELRPHGVHLVLSAPGPVESGFGDAANLRMGGGLSADLVARGSLHALGRKAVVRPGGLSKLLGWSLAISPRRMRTFILGRIFRGFTSHQTATADPKQRTAA
jgi:short-subunit dehydrogenase